MMCLLCGKDISREYMRAHVEKYHLVRKLWVENYVPILMRSDNSSEVKISN